MKSKKICWIMAIILALQLANAASGGAGSYYLDLDTLDLENEGLMFNINDMAPGLSQANSTILASLAYSGQSSYDEDNDGAENLDGVIDYSIAGTSFNWNADRSKLCTRWEVYSIDSGRLTSICYGSADCCRFANLAPSRDAWSENLYLTYGMHGASRNNVVSAQVIYVDYNLSAEKPYSKIFYSRWKSLQAIFRDENASNISIEGALAEIEKIRGNNRKIKKIELKDDDGNELKNISSEGNLSIVFNVSNAGNGLMAAAAGPDSDVIVSVNNFNALDANWEKSSGINISTENSELEGSLKDIGIDAKAIVSVKGISGFLDESYDGTVSLVVPEYFNSVIYCPDDTIASCRLMHECAQGAKEAECYIKNSSEVTVFVPHFSSIIVALDNTTLNITINSPDNSSPLESGENIYLEITSNETAGLNYSFDGRGFKSLGNGTSFNSSLNGTLPYGTLENGQHNLSIYVKNALGSSIIMNYSFTVNDTLAPGISINITNNTAFNGTSLLLPFNISSGEYANITYRINNNNFSASIDLGAAKNKTINLTPSNGQNNLTINASDLNYNSIVNYFSFNFTLTQAPSCSDAAQNGDETGIDCGGTCFSCINFSVATDKSSYNLTQSVQITVIARANSTVNVTVLKQNAVAYRHNFIPVFAGAPIAESRIISNTSNAGNYTINATMHYLNISENKNSSFEVLAPSSNPISVTISANATTINEGNPIIFSSDVSGNISAVSYKWDFQNDGTVDSTGSRPEYTYPSNGTYTVNLTVADILWNQTDIETITVRKMHNVTVIVKDNSTGTVMQNAEVEFDDGVKNTSSEGKADYSIASGRYDLVARKPGYSTFSNRTDLSGNAIFEVSLAVQDINAPLIQLLGPSDKEITSASPVFNYKATDASSMTCKLYLNENSTLWKLEGIDYNVQSDANSSFALANLKNSSYRWQIECTDRSGNSNLSEIFSFAIDGSLVDNQLSVSLEEQDKDAEDIFAALDSISAEMETWPTDEKEAAEAIQLKKTLEKGKTAIQRANRDLHSLKWRRLNQSELDIETEKILGRIQSVKDTTPKNIEVTSKNEFVKYPNKDDIGKALGFLINSTNLKFSKKDTSRLVQENFRHQSLITVTTSSRTLDVEYISGNRNALTLIQKKVTTQNELDNFVFLEVIPKEFAKNVRDMEMLFEYEVVEADPIVKIDLQKTREYVYYTNKSVTTENTEKIKSILLSKDLKKKDESLITGFVSLDGFGDSFVKTLDIRLLAELVAIVLLFLVFLYYQFGYGKMDIIFDKKLRENAVKFESAINKIGSSLSGNNYGEAKASYNEAASAFKDFPPNLKADAYKKLADARDKLDFAFMSNSLSDAMLLLSSNQKEKAAQLYAAISGLYKNLPKDYKSQIHAKCLELHKKLS